MFEDRGRSTFGLDRAVRMHSVRQCPDVYVVSVPSHLGALGVRKSGSVALSQHGGAGVSCFHDRPALA